MVGEPTRQRGVDEGPHIIKEEPLGIRFLRGGSYLMAVLGTGLLNNSHLFEDYVLGLVFRYIMVES